MNILIYRHNDRFLESFEKTHKIMMKLYELNIQNRNIFKLHRMKDMERRRNLKRSSVSQICYCGAYYFNKHNHFKSKRHKNFEESVNVEILQSY